jgi:hypothetical protein
MVFIEAQRRLYLAILIFMITVVFSVGGCSSLSKKDDKATAPASKTSSAVAARYYDFGDVLVHLLFTKLAVFLPVYWF